MERKVIVIVGPTCSGKTFLGLKLAQKYETEVISADSRQIYKHLNIGTAKPTAAEIQNIKHHFIDELEPDEYFNVSIFEKNSLNIIETLFDKNKIPIICGGSGLYIKAVIDGIFDTSASDPDYREHLLKLKKEKGNQYLYDILMDNDKLSASKMLPQNWKRVIRALEVLKVTGKSIQILQQEHERNLNINFVQIGLNWERKLLYENIERRVDDMMSAGLLEEAKSLLAMGYSNDLNSLNTVGYKEIISYLNNEINLERAIELIKRNTKHFAKRQLTWFRKDKRITWYDLNSILELENLSLIL